MKLRDLYVEFEGEAPMGTKTSVPLKINEEEWEIDSGEFEINVDLRIDSEKNYSVAPYTKLKNGVEKLSIASIEKKALMNMDVNIPYFMSKEEFFEVVSEEVF